MPAMLTAQCLCGEVRVDIAKRPDFIHECNCTLCRKTGARWAYFAPEDISVEGETAGYIRSDKPNAGADVRFCNKCGATTHFVLTTAAIARFGNTVAGVNMWLADQGELAGTELRFPDGRSWAGEGEFGYLREPVLLSGH